jgi:hypothetical protein
MHFTPVLAQLVEHSTVAVITYIELSLVRFRQTGKKFINKKLICLLLNTTNKQKTQI